MNLSSGQGKTLRTAVGLLAALATCAGSPVIDDEALESQFIEGLRRPGVDGLDGANATRAVGRAETRKARLEAGDAAPAGNYEEVCRSVVVVGSIGECQKCDDWHMDSVSSGWIIGPDGHIATNHHVLEDKEAGELGVMTSDGKVYAVQKIVAADREGDAAILKVDTTGSELPALPLAAAARTGEKIRVVGHPDGRFYTLTEGIVSRVFSQAVGEGDERRTWVSVTADYGAGSSGAPVLNSAGEVVAMVSSTAALLADTEEGKEPAASDVQMVFRDCVSVDTLRGLIAE